MRFVTVLAASVLPGLAWVWFFYRQDRYDKEPPTRIAITFAAGMVAVVPAALIQLPFREWLLEPSRLVARFARGLPGGGTGGGSDEAPLGLPCRLPARSLRRAARRDHLRGHRLAGVCGFGKPFLRVELRHRSGAGPGRGHHSGARVLGGVAGLSLGIAPRGTPEGVGLILRGLFIAALLHGVYDFLILSRLLHPVFGLLIVYLTYRFVAGKIRQLRRRRVR